MHRTEKEPDRSDLRLRLWGGDVVVQTPTVPTGDAGGPLTNTFSEENLA